MKNPTTKPIFECQPFENGLGITLGNQKFVLSYDEVQFPWAEAKEWCENQGGTLPTIDQLLTMYENRGAINDILAANSKETLAGWYWSSREHSASSERAWLVIMSYGTTFDDLKYHTSNVRAVSAFPLDIK